MKSKVSRTARATDNALPAIRAAEIDTNRRQFPDRRAYSWQMVVDGHRRSRRRDSRRSGNATAVFVDWYHPWLFLLSLGIMLLSCLDAFLTLQLLNLGMIAQRVRSDIEFDATSKQITNHEIANSYLDPAPRKVRLRQASPAPVD